LSESFASHAYGEIDRTQEEGPLSASSVGASYMAFNGVRLEEYVAKYPKSKLAATPATSKLGCYEITTWQEKPEGVGSNYDICDVRIFVDPKVGFWMRRIEKGSWQKSANPGDKGTTILDVQEFKDCGNGVFWPVRAYHNSRLPGGTIGPDILVRHIVHSINQPLTAEDFEIHFPDWLRVFDRRSDKVLLWGPDDKPRITFVSQNEYMEWYKPRAEDLGMAGIPQRTRLTLVVGISLLVGLMVLAILWRRSRKARRLKTEPIKPA
jgi:hypothetical protein